MVRKIREKQRTLLIDGSLLVYRVATGIEEPIEWEHEVWTLSADANLGKQIIDNGINHYSKLLNCNKVIVAFDDKENFRKNVIPDYKSNRKSNRKPTCYKGLKKYIIDKYETVVYPNLEGDDVLGILATSPEYKDNCIIVSSDKDMRTIPAIHHFMHDSSTEVVDEKSADYNFMYQTLIGDLTDGYKGCPTVGAVKAQRILEKSDKTLSSMWKAVVEEYKRQNLDEQYAISQARLARILRYTDWDNKNKQPILWSPNDR